MRLALLIIVLAVVSCSTCGMPQVRAKSMEAHAVEIVWRGVYRMTASAPSVIWVCNHCPGSGYEGICNIEFNGGCYGGLSFWRHNVAMVNDNWPYARNSFSHELLHSVLVIKYGDPDAEHSRKE